MTSIEHQRTTKIPYLSSMEAVQEKLSSEQWILLVFTATWCGPCHAMRPFVESLRTTYPVVSVFYIDVDAAEEVSQAFRIDSMPTYCLFRGKALVNRFSGADKEKLGLMVQSAVDEGANEIQSQ